MKAFSLVKPVITEKSLKLAQTANAFTFEVERGATKEHILMLVEELYHVHVTSVNTIVGHKQAHATGKKRLVRVQPKIKKAIVTLKKGENIDVFDVPKDQPKEGQA